MREKHGWIWLVVVGICLLGVAGDAWAVTDSGSGTFLDTLGTKSFRLLTMVAIPLLAVAFIVGFAINYNRGAVTLGEGSMRLLISAGAMIGGISFLTGFLGGNIAMAMVLP